MNEIYGPALNAVNGGIAQTFDYGIAMTCLSLCLIASVGFNVFLLSILRMVLPLITKLKEVLK